MQKSIDFDICYQYLCISFVALPPCLATTIMVKVQTGSYKWMLFSIIFPTCFGLAVASGVFRHHAGLERHSGHGRFLRAALATAIGLSFLPDPAWKQGGPVYANREEASP